VCVLVRVHQNNTDYQMNQMHFLFEKQKEQRRDRNWREQMFSQSDGVTSRLADAEWRERAGGGKS